MNLMELTIHGAQQAYLSGQLTCREMVEFYLARIDAYDRQGPCLNAVITVNPHALEEADKFDVYVRKNHALCGPLHGVPVLLKDNFDTKDMETTAGSLALKGWVPPDSYTRWFERWYRRCDCGELWPCGDGDGYD